MSRGHHAEFRGLFREEAETRLGTLVEHADAIERGDEPTPLLDAMFRDAHTLKGGAAVVGFEDIARTLLELERELDDLRSARVEIQAGTPAHIRERAGAIRAEIAAEMAKVDEA